MTSRLLLAASLLAFACLALALADDGMAACQTNHSFDVCHDAIH